MRIENKRATKTGWEAQGAFNKWLKLQERSTNLRKTTGTGIIPEDYIGDRPLTVRDWQQARIVAARLVKRLGKEYMPLFERVEAELQKAEQENSAMVKIDKLLQSVSKLKGDFIKV